MTKQEKIRDLTDEILRLEPELKGREGELGKVLTHLLELDDRVHIDETFRRNLKAKLLITQVSNSPQAFRIKDLFTMKKLTYVLASLALIAVGASSTGLYLKQNQSFTANKKSVELFSKDTVVTNAGKNAFGSLASINAGGLGGRNQSGGGGGAGSSNQAALPPSATAEDAKLAAGYGGGTDSIYPYQPYKFVYKGEALNLTEAEALVYKRIKNAGGNTSEVASILKSISLGLVDLNKFQNLGITSFTLTEDREFGYQITVNAAEGTMYINENWERWNLPERQCQDETCFQKYRLSQKDMPGDSAIIATADAFLAEYSIPRGNFGTPVVQKYWAEELARSADSSSIYFPDTVGVVYPYIIDGKEAIDEGGNPTGMYVNVNIRNNKVSSVSEITVPNYQSSDYALETDAARILKFAENGGYTDKGQYPQGTKVTEVTLGTPTRALVRSWVYSGTKSDELFAPALVFPVMDSSNDRNMYYQKFVIVPLVKEILDQRSKQTTPPYPIIMDTPVAIPTPAIEPKPTSTPSSPGR